jgi:(S)-2-hydroxyglutarate dehydrogenase
MDPTVMNTSDVIIIGGGIVGLTLARAFLLKDPSCKVVVLEKEVDSISHGTGRNSGVIHSGIYYAENSLRAKLCVQGAVLMREYADNHGLWIDHCGKLLIPPTEGALASIPVLKARGEVNGVEVVAVGAEEMRELEPRSNTHFAQALFIPVTAVVDPKAVAKAVLGGLGLAALWPDLTVATVGAVVAVVVMGVMARLSRQTAIS